MAQSAAPALRWLVNLRHGKVAAEAEPSPGDDRVYAMIERLESVLEAIGTLHDRKYDAEEAFVLRAITQREDGKLFEQGHERLGKLLGFKSGNSDEEAAPDPWWIVDDTLAFVFEDHAEGDAKTVFSPTKARQAASHPNWIHAKLIVPDDAVVIPILVTPCSKASSGAVPHLKKVRYWHVDAFTEWAEKALHVIRDVRREFAGPGDLTWRSKAADRLIAAKIAPAQLQGLLDKSAADAMTEVAAPKGDEQ